MRSAALVLGLAVFAGWVATGQPTTIAANAEAATQPPIGATPEVRSIALDGRGVPAARLRALLETRPGEPLDPTRLARDREAMLEELASLGYLAARIEPAVITYDAGGAAYVSFDIDPGKLFQLRDVSVTGPGSQVVVVTLGRGDPAVRTRIERARQALVDGLARRGKRAAVELSVHTDLAAAAVDVVFATRSLP